MHLYSIVLSLHIAAATVLVGGSILVAPTVRRWIRDASTVSGIRHWLAATKPLAAADPISALVLLATGVYLASIGHWWRLGWVQIALVMWFVNSGIARKFVGPAMGRVAELASSAETEEIGADLETARNSRALTLARDVMLANDLGILFLMSSKPGYLGSVVTMVVANALVVGFRTIQDRSVDHRREGKTTQGPGAHGVVGHKDQVRLEAKGALVLASGTGGASGPMGITGSMTAR